ncbi:DUF1845 domain-containing protein [Burkholderia vietnamiensis]|nr:DUF1845 domain-containing protein [Burkholderia vietnamiensis]MBR8191563.1 DUF1845 domain-containing protein [Burkholderia vietnamiensis]QTK86115.1 DUF1845 domain-containing protein [Burkholderia vietnamiensis]
MAAVLELPPDPHEEPSPSAAPPVSNTPVESAPTASGLKPIQRLTSDTRIARIIPTSDSKTELRYRSQFARTFIRGDYNFCASKIAVARGGKTRALEIALRDLSEWLRKATAWVEKHNARKIEFPSESIKLEITRPLAGLLVRCLTQYDRLFVSTMEAVLADKITAQDRATILANAEGRIKHITLLCVPDTDQYDFDGSLRDA